MRDLALDPATGDLLVSNGSCRLTVANSPEAVGQRLRIRLARWKGENVLNADDGFPYLDLLGVPGAIDLFTRKLRECAATCPGIASIDSFSVAVDPTTRTAAVTLRGRTTGGEPVSLDAYQVTA